MIRHIAKHDHLPDYHVTFDDEVDQVTFKNRDSWWDHTHAISAAGSDELPQLPGRAIEEAKSSAPGYDVYALEQEWREWWASSGKPKLENPAAAFVGFCASRNKRKPMKSKKVG